VRVVRAARVALLLRLRKEAPVGSMERPERVARRVRLLQMQTSLAQTVVTRTARQPEELGMG